MSNHFCVFDLETDSLDTAIASPVEVACAMIDPFSIELIDGSEFQSFMKPPGIEDRNKYMSNPAIASTVKWHSGQENCSIDDILDKWSNYPEQSVVWNLFAQHLSKYNRRQSQWDAPIPAGQNIRAFDLPIVERLNEKYKIKKLFHKAEVCDLRDITFLWLRWDADLTSRSMDNLRKYFNVKSRGKAHTAMADVYEEAELIIRFLKLHKDLFSRINFKGKEEEND
jgi:hypothetical protein